MKTPFNIISLSCFQISSQCFIVLDIRVICMQINWVLHVFYDCEKLQVGMHITCSGARYSSCMHEKMRFHPCAFRSWAQNNWKGWIVWWGVGVGGLRVLINTLPNSWIFPQKQVDGVIYLELRTWRFYGQNTWFL